MFFLYLQIEFSRGFQMATKGAVSPTELTLGLKIESTSGVLETTPGVYVILGAESRPTSGKDTSDTQVYGNADPVYSTRKEEKTSMSLPMLPLLDANGLGELLLSHFGDDDISTQFGTTGAYKHAFTRANTFKTLTAWVRDGLHDKIIRMLAAGTFSLTVSRDDGMVKPVFDLVGANMEETAGFGSPSFIDVDATIAQQLVASQARLEWGQPGANIRDTWKEIAFKSSRNPVNGLNGKDGMHIAGSSSPQLVTTSKTDTTMDVTFIDTDGEEERRIREGTDAAPTAVRHADNAGLINYRFTLISNIIGSAGDPWGEADINNIGTTTVVVSGTYSGGAAVLTTYEVILAQGTPDTYSYRSCTGGVWSAWSTPEAIMSGSFKLGLDAAAAQVVTFNYAGLVAGATIAAAIQTAIQTLGGDYTAMTCVFSSPNYVITHATKQPVVTAATRNDVSAALKLGVANGGTETGSASTSNGGVITLAASVQDLADGIKLLFSSSTLGAALDRYYVYSHRVRMLRATSLSNRYKDLKDSGGRDFNEKSASAYHTSGPGATKPLVELVNARATAYS
jgi:hypothetical protein